MHFSINHFYIVKEQFAILMKQVIKYDFGIIINFRLVSSSPLFISDI